MVEGEQIDNKDRKLITESKMGIKTFLSYSTFTFLCTLSSKDFYELIGMVLHRPKPKVNDDGINRSLSVSILKNSWIIFRIYNDKN